MEGVPLPWVSPDPRALLFFADVHVPRRLERLRRQSPFRLTVDAAFPAVMAACAATHTAREGGTWITAAMRRAYARLHALGYAHSAEAWDGEALVGGVYGVEVDGVFSAESMFYRRPNASRIALLHLIDWLAGRGFTWMDVQQLTPHMEAMGARAVPRRRFLDLLAARRREYRTSHG